jgi:hypothetical protein
VGIRLSTDRMGKKMKLIVLLCILVLCTACGPWGLPAAEPSPTRSATQTPQATSQTASLVPPTATSTPLLPSPTPVFEVIIDNVAVDQQGRVYASGFGSSSDSARHFAQWDGAKWIALGTGVESAGSASIADSASQLYTTILTDSNQGMATAIVRWDAAGWEDITGNFSTVVDALQAGRISSNIPVAGLAVDGEDNLYVAGSFFYPSADHTAEWPMGYVARWNKETWTVLGQGFDQVNIHAMAVSATGQVYVSGEQSRGPAPAEGYSIAGFIARWDGETWTEIGTSKLNWCLSITTIAWDEAGGLYASCTGSEAGAFIFYWDGADWTTIADQLQGEAPYVADMAVDQNSQLYIGGSFDSVSGIPARNIAYWDGNAWHALGDGVNGQVYALAYDPGGGLYAAGSLTEAGGLTVQHVARWDGQTWHALGP